MILITVPRWHQYGDLPNGYSLLLLILQSFDWLAGFHFEMLLAILLIAV